MTLLLLIRHGVTDVTGTRLVGWTPGVHLSETGREQADAVRDRLGGTRIDAIYSSPLERCRETAQPLAAERRLPIRIRKGIGEVAYGSWTNRPLKQLARTKLWRRVQIAPSRMRFPEGEAMSEARSRAVTELDRIVTDHPRHVVAVFSHADVIKLVVAEFAGIHMDLFQRIVVDPASVCAVEIGGGVPRLLRINDTGSLASLAPRRRRGH
ncbi:MAG: MSMEG_4193 family putative phosphomutase [Actinomycetota bacterium]